MSELVGMPVVNGTEVSVAAVVIADGALKSLPPTKAGLIRYANKATNTDFTLAEIKSGSGIFASASPGQIVWRLPCMAALGYTYSDASALSILMMQKGTGTLFCNPSICRSPLGGGTQGAMLAVVGASIGDTYIIGTTMYVLGGNGTAATLSNWGTGFACAAIGVDPTAYTGVTVLDPQGLNISAAVQGQRAELAAIANDMWAWV